MKRWLLLTLPLLVLLAPAAPTEGQGGGRAGVVVRFGDGSIHTSCVSFAGDSISGLELLQRSGLDVIAQAAGNNAAVCKIGPDGCNYPAESCLGCRFGAGQQGEYWAYWQLAGGSWRYGQLGAGARRVRNGEVDGWAYGPGNVQSEAQPPVVTFEQICPVPTNPPSPVPPTAVPPTPVPPTPVPPTPVPPTQIIPTAVPPTRVPPTPVPPTTQPTELPTPPAAGAAPSVAASISATAVSSATPTTVLATATSEPSATIIPSSTAAPTATSVPANPTVTPTALPASAGDASTAPSADWTDYGLFVAMFVLLLGAIGITVWRQRR